MPLLWESAMNMLDTELITHNMRSSWAPQAVSTLAKKHPPFGEPVGTAVRWRRVHRVHGVRIDYPWPGQAYFLAVWKCGQTTRHPRLLHNLNDSVLHLCPKCFPHGRS